MQGICIFSLFLCVYSMPTTRYANEIAKITMTQKTYPLPLSFEQILNIVLQLPAQEQEEIIQQIKINSPKNQEEDLLTVFDRIGKNAQAKGLTEEILEELLADES